MKKQIWEIGGSGYAYIQDKHRVKERSLLINEDVNEDVNGYFKQYLTFEAIEDTTFTFDNHGSGYLIKYSLDNGESWELFDYYTPLFETGTKVCIKAVIDESYDGGSEGDEVYGFNLDIRFNSTGKFNVSGNIMSLLYGDDFIGKTDLDLTGKEYALNELFCDCTSLVDASNLILPATTLIDGCYSSMFYGCTSLVTAPVLPATTLAEYCYHEMFSGCINLNNITMLATDISASNCLNSWVDGVASTGTFTKHPDMTSLPTGNNGIPEGWTVEDYHE